MAACISVVSATCTVCFSCEWLYAWGVSVGSYCLHAWSVSVGSATHMVCFRCEWLHAWSVAVVSGCMHGEFEL